MVTGVAWDATALAGSASLEGRRIQIQNEETAKTWILELKRSPYST